MELTGETKIEFEKWYANNHCKGLTSRNLIKLEIKLFYSMHSSMQFGVYQDYFDSVGIYTSTCGLVLSKTYLADVSVQVNSQFNYDALLSRSEARTASIKKANEIRNEQLK